MPEYLCCEHCRELDAYADHIHMMLCPDCRKGADRETAREAMLEQLLDIHFPAQPQGSYQICHGCEQEWPCPTTLVLQTYYAKRAQEGHMPEPHDIPETPDFNPMAPGHDTRTFRVKRRKDSSGTSGTGAVALGAVFPDGTTVIRWQSRVRSTVVFASMADALYIHGHGNDTGFVFDADPSFLHLSGGDREPS